MLKPLCATDFCEAHLHRDQTAAAIGQMHRGYTSARTRSDSTYNTSIIRAPTLDRNEDNIYA